MPRMLDDPAPPPTAAALEYSRQKLAATYPRAPARLTKAAIREALEERTAELQRSIAGGLGAERLHDAKRAIGSMRFLLGEYPSAPDR